MKAMLFLVGIEWENDKQQTLLCFNDTFNSDSLEFRKAIVSVILMKYLIVNFIELIIQIITFCRLSRNKMDISKNFD